VASILSLDHQSRYQHFPHINISSMQNYYGLILAGHFYWFGRFVPSTGIFTWTALLEPYVSGFGVQCQNTYICCRGPGFESWVWILTFFHADILGRLGSNLVFIVLFGTLYLEFGSMASSFWNHVIQISIRQVYFQHIYSQLWIVKIFTENIYFL
jgi:hypothetical protein